MACCAMRAAGTTPRKAKIGLLPGAANAIAAKTPSNTATMKAYARARRCRGDRAPIALMTAAIPSKSQRGSSVTHIPETLSRLRQAHSIDVASGAVSRNLTRLVCALHGRARRGLRPRVGRLEPGVGAPRLSVRRFPIPGRGVREHRCHATAVGLHNL